MQKLSHGQFGGVTTGYWVWYMTQDIIQIRKIKLRPVLKNILSSIKSGQYIETPNRQVDNKSGAAGLINSTQDWSEAFKDKFYLCPLTEMGGDIYQIPGAPKCT